MDTKQLLDSLADHMALFHKAMPAKHSNSQFRKNVIHWMSSLTLAQRQAALTTVDEQWIAILLQMNDRLRNDGAGFFIVLPDLIEQKRNASQRFALPSLCYRKARGLLARVLAADEAETALIAGLRLFGSTEGRDISELSPFDALTVSEDFVKDIDKFVSILDSISNSEFLRCSNYNSSAWEELPWLKAKGYYSIAAFVANRLEISLGLSWLQSRGKRHGPRSSVRNCRDLGYSAFCRKKSLIDWWSKVSTSTREHAFRLSFVKAAKFEVVQHPANNEKWSLRSKSKCNLSMANKISANCYVKSIVKSIATISSYKKSNLYHSFPENLCGLCICANTSFDALYRLQSISSSFNLDMLVVPVTDRLFLSTLQSVNSISDDIMRRMRDLLSRLSHESVEFDLLGEDNLKVKENYRSLYNPQIQKREKRKKGRKARKKHLINQRVIENVSSDQASCKINAADQKVVTHRIDGSEGSMQRKNCGLEEVNHLRTHESKTDTAGQSVIELPEAHLKKIQNRKRRSKSKNKEAGSLQDTCLQRKEESRYGDHVTEVQDKVAPVCVESQNACLPKVNAEHNLISAFSQAEISGTINCGDSSMNSKHIHSANVDNICSNGCSSIWSDDPCVKECFMDTDNCNGSISDLRSSSLSEPVLPSILVGCQTHSLENDKGCQWGKSGSIKDVGVSFDGHSNSSVFVESTSDITSTSFLPSMISAASTDLNHGEMKNGDRITDSGKYVNSKASSLQIHKGDRVASLGAWSTLRHREGLQRKTSTNAKFSYPVHDPDRLHLDVDQNWHHREGSVIALKQSWHTHLGHGGYNKRPVLSQPPKNIDWSQVLQTSYPAERGLNTIYPAGCIPEMESKENSSMKNDSKNEVGEDRCCCEYKSLPCTVDDVEGFPVSEDEADKHSRQNISTCFDYSKVFGGGIMYWNTADYGGAGYSRPPSLSSEDSSWARHEDDLKLVIDDVVSIATIPTPYGNEFSGSFLSSTGASILEEQESRSTVMCNSNLVDGGKGEMLADPILRPIVVPSMSRQMSRTDLKATQECRSSHVPTNRREASRVKRPPSPVVLCVPSHPLSPVRGFRKQRCFPAVRSGSSSPRHWGMNNWFSETETEMDESCFPSNRPDLAGISWRNKYVNGTTQIPLIIHKLPLEDEHPDIALPLQSPDLGMNASVQIQLAKLQNILHEEIESFCKQISGVNQRRKPFINAAIEKVSRALQVLWPRSRTKIFGSAATGLALPTSDVDLVVCLPPVRNLEPIKEAGILEGRNGIKETCLQHAARYLADQEWVQNESLKTVENTAIPIIKLIAKVPSQQIDRSAAYFPTNILRNEPWEEDTEGNAIAEDGRFSRHSSTHPRDCETENLSQDLKESFECVALDISFESSSHTGLRTAALVRELIGHFPPLMPLALVLKQFLTDRCLDHPYSGGLSSYCLVLLITRFLQHEHHIGHSVNQNLGSLLMDFLYFFGCVFDPRQMRVSIYGSGMYVNRGRSQSIDPLHIDDPLDDPLHPINNVGRNCFRIHQCIKAFADAHSTLQKELLSDLPDSDKSCCYKVLSKIIPSIGYPNIEQT